MNELPQPHPLVEPLTRLFTRLLRQPGLDVRTIVNGLVNALDRGDVCVLWKTLFECDADPILISSYGLIGSPADSLPLVLDAGGRLYLQHFHRDEEAVALAVRQRISAAPPALDPVWLAKALAGYFPWAEKGDLQQLAAETAVNGWFTIISGGPGTGKTHTVLTILALLIEQSQTLRSPPLRIALLAPTGKAAARLKESITQSLNRLQLPEAVRAAIPSEAQTIDRWLGAVAYEKRQSSSSTQTAIDVVVVDEASMIGLPLFARLIDAVPISARLILLGDQNQLAPVEAGSVLGDLTDAGKKQPLASLGKRMVELQKSRRFGTDSGIGQLAQAILAGAIDQALRVMSDASDVRLISLSDASELRRVLRDNAIEHYVRLTDAPSPEAAFSALGDFRLLAAINEGPFGIRGINATIVRLLGLENAGIWYHGRPILITENDHALGLFNGDTGIAWREPGEDGDLRVWFPADDAGSFRQFAPSALPSHETAYAITAHRSQGSEFKRVLVVLPPLDLPVLTRELFYTAVTRASSEVTIVCEVGLLSLIVNRSLTRVSGLQDYFTSDSTC